MEQVWENISCDTVNFVDYRSNKDLSDIQVSFHWWNAGHTTMHYHNHYEFFIITLGRTLHILNGRQETLEEGTMFLIRPQDVHQFVPAENEKCIHINIAAVPARFDLLCAALGISSAQLTGGQSLRVSLNRDEIAYFMHQARQLSYFARDENDRIAFRLTICEMLAQGIALIYKKRLMQRISFPPWLQAVLEQLHVPEFMDCSAEDVYRLAGYSAPAVIRYFKLYTGETVHSYLVKLKMDWAVQLFCTTDMTVLEVSDALGYASLSHFGKLFTRHTGLCPRAYRARRENWPL